MNTHKPRRLRTSKKAIAALTAAGLIACSATALASSHREAPNITGSPRVDGTDLYAFQSYENAPANTFTTIIANYNPSQNPGDGPNYYAFDPNAVYEIHVDNTGDGVEDLTYRLQFSQALAGGNGIALPINGTNVAIPLKVAAPITAGNSASPPNGTDASPAGLNFIQTYTVNVTTNDRNSNGTRKAGTISAVKNAVDNTTVFTKPMDNIGTKTFPNGYAAYANSYVYSITLPNCSTAGRVFVGQRKEGFSVNLNHVFDLINVGANNVPVNVAAEPEDATNGGTNTANGIAKSTANNYLAGKNVTSIALEIPTACLTGETVPGTPDATHNGVVGIWTTASLPQAQLLNPGATFALPVAVGGAYTQVSRLGMPLVNELVIGLKDKDHFNASKPINDAQFGTYVTNPTLPALLQSLFSTTTPALVAPTNFPRTDLEATFLTGIQGVNQLAAVTPSEMLRLNTTIAPVAAATQDHLGVLGNDLAGFPNGRRPGDEAVDVTLRVAMGKLCTLSGTTQPAGPIGGCVAGDAPSGNLDYTDGAQIDQTQFLGAFPYLGTPISGD